MSTTAERCLELFKQCSAIEKRTLLNLMNEDVQDSLDESNAEKTCDAALDTPDHFSFSKFISFHDSFVDDNAFLESLRTELDSMDLNRPQSKKIKSLWINPSDACDDINSISKYPNISKLLDMVNAQISDAKKALDCCNIFVIAMTNSLSDCTRITKPIYVKLTQSPLSHWVHQGALSLFPSDPTTLVWFTPLMRLIIHFMLCTLAVNAY